MFVDGDCDCVRWFVLVVKGLRTQLSQLTSLPLAHITVCGVTADFNHPCWNHRWLLVASMHVASNIVLGFSAHCVLLLMLNDSVQRLMVHTLMPNDRIF